ncbi:hypothetical protein GCM10011396_10000 [Undibacterium terreum]|uniref:CENP-V/GFA domain-containing protein n=2 Tax=Undibacterium terreum TaxID=1224302 RepID=A0A916UBJ6_9BURK|nr:hypothetical protein GCM10011396_10000 [Undibacterium terreum]
MSPPFPAQELLITQGKAELALYQFNTHVAKHYFCKHCGVYAFHQIRNNPLHWRVNIGCLHSVDPYALEAGVDEAEESASLSEQTEAAL